MNRKMFKELSFLKKVQWIFQYYGLTMAVVAAVIVTGTAFLRSVLGPQAHYAISVMILDEKCSADDCRLFTEELEEKFGDVCDVTSYLEKDSVQRQAFVVRLASEKLDLIVAPESEMSQMMENGYLEYMQKLEADSRYFAVTRRSDDPEEAVYYIGKSVRNMNEERIEDARAYFTDPC